MNENKTSFFEDIVNIIEDNLVHPLNLDELSKHVAISKYHLDRLFKSISGTSLMAYVRARRLSISLRDLMHSDMKIIDIALKYQFGYEQSYIRAFQNQFQITPAKYRRLKFELPIQQKIDTSLTEINQGFVIRPRMVLTPEFYIQGIKEEIFHGENLLLSTTNKLAELFHYTYLPNVPNRINEHIYLAIIKYLENPSISNDYIPCVETSMLNKPDLPFIAMKIPAHEYAVFRYVGLHAPDLLNYKTLKELYDYIFYWVKNTKYRQLSLYHYERMDLSICSDSYCEMDIYIPIGE